MFEYSPKYKLIFKQDKRNTGLARVGQMIGSDIRYRKNSIGRIHKNSVYGADPGVYRVGLKVVKPQQQVFEWVYFKAKFGTMEAAKEWTKTNFVKILEDFESKGYIIQEHD